MCRTSRVAHSPCRRSPSSPPRKYANDGHLHVWMRRCPGLLHLQGLLSCLYHVAPHLTLFASSSRRSLSSATLLNFLLYTNHSLRSVGRECAQTGTLTNNFCSCDRHHTARHDFRLCCDCDAQFWSRIESFTFVLLLLENWSDCLIAAQLTGTRTTHRTSCSPPVQSHTDARTARCSIA